jgi:hypothetical protein
METVEIRQNKKILIPMLVILSLALVGTFYYIFLSGKFDHGNIIKLIYVLLTASLGYAIYVPTRKFIKNEPVLKLSKSEIELNEKGKPVSFLWIQVIGWKIEKDTDSSTHYLVVQTTDTKKKINISWLDRKPAEIEELLIAFSKASNSGF